MKIYILQVFRNEYNAKHEVVAVWTEFPQYGHVQDVLFPFDSELTANQIEELLGNGAVQGNDLSSWSLDSVEEGVRLI